MKNYLIYVRASANKQTPEDLSVCDQIEMLKEYAKFHRWNVVGHVADEDEPCKCGDQTSVENLRRYLEKYKDIDVVVTAEIQPFGSVDYTAMKTILDLKGINLIVINIRREEDEESTDDSPLTNPRA